VVGHAVQPVADGVAGGQAVALFHEDEQGGLEGVVGVVRVAEQPPADAEDHRRVAADEGGEGVLVVPGEERLEELPVGACAAVEQGGPVEVAQHAGELSGRHRMDPVNGRVAPATVDVPRTAAARRRNYGTMPS
jgi:hypothetical protein